MADTITTDTSRERLPIIPYTGHCSRAINFFKMPNVFFALGRTSPWAADETTDPAFVPPEPDMNATTLDELIGMKKLSRQVLVKPDNSGSVIYGDTTWKVIGEDEALASGAHWVLCEATILESDLPLVDYRQIGIFSNVVKKADVSIEQTALLPGEIESVGILEVLQNRHVNTRQSGVKDLLYMIIEF